MPSYPHTTFSTIITNPDGTTAGVQIPDPQYTDEEKAVIQLALDGESLFNNPVETMISQAGAAATNAKSHLNTLNTTPTADLFGELDGVIASIDSLITEVETTFKKHTARVSGASGGTFYDVPDGQLYGFNALQGIASAFNGAKDAMRSDDDPVEDNYSIHFSSILDAGKTYLSDVKEYFGGDGTKLGGFIISPTEELNLGTGDISIVDGQIDAFADAGEDIRERDNAALSDSVSFLEKYSRGNMVLSMNKDTSFGGTLLNSLETPTLKAALDAVDDV